MSYSFSQARFTRWSVKTKVVKVSVGDQAFKYHLATLPNSVMADLESHTNPYSSINGNLFHWWLLSEKPDNAEENPMLHTKRIYMLDSTDFLKSNFAIEDLLVHNVGVLQMGNYDNLAEELPQAIPGRVTFSMQPVIGGIPYSSGTLSKGHLAALFVNPATDAPIALDVYLRHTVNVYNN